MTTQYTPILKLALPVTGELSGTWGTVVNDNITSMVEQAVAGLSTINTWTSDAHTLTTADGTSSESRCAMLVAQNGAGLTGAGTITCPPASKLYVLKNATSHSITLKASGTINAGSFVVGFTYTISFVGTTDFQLIGASANTIGVSFTATGAGTGDGTATDAGVAVPAGDTAFLFCNGTSVNACVTTIVNGHISGNLTVDGNTTLGNATSDTITATARFNTDLLPSTDNARDLGSTANSWRTLYCDTSVLTPLVTATNLQVTNIKANDGTAVAVLTDSTGATDFSKAFTLSAIAQNISLGASQTTGTFVLGGTAATGAITLDASTKTHTLGVGSGATESGATKTINIGTGGVSGSTTTIGIGSINGTTTTLYGTVQTAGFNAITIDTTNLEVTNIKAKDGTAAIVLTDSTGAVSISTNLTIGDASGDTLTINGTAVSTPNGLNFDSDTLVIDAANNRVGVGTNAPSYPFHVYGNSDVTSVSAAIQNAGTSDVGLRFIRGSTGLGFIGNGSFVVSGGSATDWGMTATNNMVFAINAVEKMRLASAVGGVGALGIGYTSLTSVGDSGLAVLGNVGIGTNAPGSKLDVLGGVSSTSDWGNVNITSRNVINSANRIYAGLKFQDSGSGDAGAIGYSYNGTGYNMFFGTVASVGGAVTTRLAITSTGEFQWKPDGTTQAMTLDASGNLGVGQTSPSCKIQAEASDGAAGGAIKYTATGVASGYMSADAEGLCLATDTAGITFRTGISGNDPTDTGTERARITSGGDLLVGTNTALNGTARLDVNALTGNNVAATLKNDAGANQWTAQVWNAGTSGDNAFIQFATETAYTGRGSITYNRGGGLVAYNTTSDYRAKDILGPVTNTGATIDALKVYNGKMKGATVERPMLIAHEAQAVTPYAVTGEKDAVDEDGKPKYQQMDVSSLVPLLIAEIQSLRARVAQLEQGA